METVSFFITWNMWLSAQAVGCSLNIRLLIGYQGTGNQSGLVFVKWRVRNMGPDWLSIGRRPIRGRVFRVKDNAKGRTPPNRNSTLELQCLGGDGLRNDLSSSHGKIIINQPVLSLQNYYSIDAAVNISPRVKLIQISSRKKNCL